MHQSDVLEGLWEEINRVHGPELAGRRVRLTILADENQKGLDQTLVELLEMAEALQNKPNHNSVAPVINSYQDQILEKYNKQGFNL